MNYELFVRDIDDLEKGIIQCEQNVDIFEQQAKDQQEKKMVLSIELSKLKDKYPAWFSKLSSEK
jgi:regulator of replication initiation timing